MQTVLFLCPHSAAKSVLAAAYFEQLAEKKGLAWRSEIAGTEPDDEVTPSVAALLSAEGLDISSLTPRLVTLEQLATASKVISLGCDIDDLVPSGSNLEHWDEVPPPSQGLEEARDLILAKVEDLVQRLTT